MSRDLDEQAYEQQMQWSLAEAEGAETPPDVTDKVMAAVHGDVRPMHNPAARARWLLAAAIVVLGVAALFGVHILSGDETDSQQTKSPTPQDPKPIPWRDRHRVSSLEDVAKLPVDARHVRVSRVGDDLLQAVATRCPKLEILQAPMAFPNERVTDRVFAIAASLPKLRELSVSGDGVTGEGIEQLVALPHLENLTITYSSLKPEACETLPLLPSLRVLDLAINKQLNDKAMQAIVRCRKLEQLNVSSCNGITADGLALITQIPLLETLSIRHLRIALGGPSDRQLSRLRRLRASSAKFQNGNPGWLPPSLTEIDLSFTSANLNTCRILTRLTPHLQKLNLSACTITDDGILMLDNLEDLREFDLSNSPFTERGLKHFLKMDRLCKLKMSALNWLNADHLEPLFAAGIDVHITKDTDQQIEADKLRSTYRAEIEERRKRVENR